MFCKSRCLGYDLNLLHFSINIKLFIMNKKISTLVAAVLAAGAWTTLEAKIVTAVSPKIGSSYVIGTAAIDAEGKMANWVNGLNNIVEASTAVNKFGTEWTLVQAKDAQGKELKDQFYLKNLN